MKLYSRLQVKLVTVQISKTAGKVADCVYKLLSPENTELQCFLTTSDISLCVFIIATAYL